MRIAIYHNHGSGGAARAIYDLGRDMAQRHEIDVYTLTSSDEGELDPQDYARAVFQFEFRPDAPVRRGVYLNELREHASLGRLRRANQAAARQIDSGDYDIVLVSACRYTQAPPLLSYLETPAAYYCHEPPRRFIDDFCRPGAVERSARARLRGIVHWPARTLIDRELRAVDRHAVDSAAMVLTNSEFTRARIRAYYGIDARVSYLGIRTPPAMPGCNPGPGYVLSVGAVENHKGYDFLIDAIGMIEVARRPRLVIVGNTAHPGLLEKLKALGRARRVECDFRIAVSQRELEAAYDGATAFAYTPRREPFGLAVLEAMARGLPVVAVAEGGVMESVAHEETGLLVAREPGLFAAALAELLQNGQERQRLASAGRARVQEEWSIAQAAARLERHLLELAASRSKDARPGEPIRLHPQAGLRG